MKTLLTLCLSVIALTAFAQNRPVPPPPPPNAPATAAPQIPGAPPIPPPAAGTSPALAPGTSPVGPVGASPAPGTTVSATLSASPATTASPAASPAPEMKATGMFTGNFLIDNFRKGGPIMWPILIVSIVGLTVVIERIFWWGGRWFRRDPKLI